MKAPQSTDFDLEKLPSKPFRVNDFELLQEPIRYIPFNIADIPDSTFNLPQATAEPFRLQQFILPKPTKIKAGAPKLMPGTTTGVLQFSTEEGLPGINITASLADQFGNTWLATEKGLCRYDGEYLYIYSFLNKNAIGSDYTTTGMTEDKQGNIWVATAGDGIYIINISTNVVQRYVSNILFSCITTDHDGIIWAGSYLSGLFVIDPVKKRIKNITYTNTTSNENSIITIKEDQYNNVWLGCFDHAAIVDKTRKRIRNITKAHGLVNSLVLQFMEDSKGDMWVSMYGGGLHMISLKNKTMGTLGPKNGFTGMAVDMAEDGRHQVWMMRKDTCYILNSDRTAIKEILLDIKMLEQGGRSGCLMDRSGNIWLGTLGKGVVIIDTKGPLPEHFTTEQGLSDNNIWGITEDDKGNIWIGTRQQVNVYDPRKDQIKIIGKQQGLGSDRTGRVTKGDNGNIFISTSGGLSMVDPQRKLATTFSDRSGILAGFSKCLADANGNLWVSSTDYGVVWYDTKNNTVKTITKQNGLLSDVNWDMIKDRQGNLWAGSDSGITVINPHNNTLKYLREKDGLCNNVVYKLLQHPNGEIWAGTLKGISIINTQNFTITNLTNREGLVPQDIYDMVEHQGIVYAGSSDGLFVIKNPGHSGDENQPWRLAKYGKREGFPFNDYNQNTGYVTKNGQSWWGVVPMLTVVTQQPLEDSALPKVNITAVNIMDEPLSFSYWASMEKYVKNGDTLWNETRTNFYLENTLPRDSGYLKDHHIHWDSVTPGFRLPIGLQLPYDQNSVNFSFINNDVKGREKILYRYILEGADKSWSDISDKSTTRNYFNLSPGRYTFKVSTKGFNGLWSKVEEYSFTILPPWWKTWWAYILYVVGAFMVIGAFSRYRSRQLIEKNVQLENKISQRTAELSKSLEELKATQRQLIQSEKMASLGELTAGIAHEIQNPLNFVNNFSEVSNELIDEMKDELAKGNYEDAKQIADDVQQNLEKINRHGKRADAIVKGMLQHSRSSSSQKEPTDINALCDEYIRLSYHGLRAKDKSFNAKFDTDFDTTIQKINIVSQDIGRVILNLLNNAFYAVNEKKKLSNNGSEQKSYEPTVVITTKKTDGYITIAVKDNGSGIPQSAIDKIFQPFFTTKPTGQGTGLGLSLSYDIVKAHGGELKVETKEGEGTTFIITLPS